MNDQHFLRLRQLCLVAASLESVEKNLCEVFDVRICFRDDNVGIYGLHNALMPFGVSFVEVVAPLKEGTTAGRYLERRKGDGGYMVILDSDDLDPWRAHVAQIDVRIANPITHEIYQGMQLHPRDTGGALLEINNTQGGADVMGPYWPAGPQWQSFVSRSRVQAITGAALQSPDPAKLAQRWGQILKRPVEREGAQWLLPLDNARLRFMAQTDDRGEGLAAIDLAVHEAPAIIKSAEKLGLRTHEKEVQVGGVAFTLNAPHS